jgi:hypothetical protein
MTTIQLLRNERLITVQMTRFEGELMEIKWPSLETGSLAVGEFITYYCEGKYVDCRVIRTHQDHVSLFIPNYRETLDFVNYNRNYPRYSINLTGLLTDTKKVHKVNIIDISQNGFGFLVEEPLPLFYRYDAILQHDFLNIHCEIIINSQSLDKTRCGTEITYIQNGALLKLQNYLLSLRLLLLHK